MKKVYLVRIVLRTDKVKVDGTCPIYLVVKLNGKFLVKFSTGESVVRENWCNKNH